jgi:hypothetical protein
MLSTPFEWVRFYRSKGLTVLKVDKGSKRCRIDDWNELPPEGLVKNITEEDNIGIRLDDLSVLDFERPELVEALFTEGVNVLSQYTWVAKTGKGYHVYMRGLPSGKKIVKADGLVEFRSGSDLFCVAPPSLHPSGVRYEWVTDVERVGIAEVSPQALERMRHKVKVLKIFEGFIKGLEKVWTESHRHNLSLWLSGVLFKLGYSLEDAEVVLKAVALLAHDSEVNDRVRALQDTYKKDRREVGAWTKLKAELESIVGVDRARELLNLLPRPQKTEGDSEGPEKPRSRYIVGGEVLDDGSLVEVVEGPRLLVYRDGAISIHEKLEHDGVVHRPYPHLPFALPKTPESLDVDPELWWDTKSFIMEYFDAPDERVYDVIVAGVAWSYFYREIRKSTPYLLFLGPWRSGKTRALEVFTALGHRALQVVDPSEASIFRIIEEFKPLLVIDEANVLDLNILAILAAAYRYGAVIPRVVDPDKGLDGIRMFHVFSFVVYASREQPRDDIFSRSVTVFCEKAVRQTKKLIDEERAAALRTRWFAQRLRLYNKVRMTFAEFESEDGRMQELFSPLLVMSRLFGDQEAERNIVSYGREIEMRVRSLETTSEEAEVVEAVVKAVEGRGPDAPEYLTNAEIMGNLNGEWEPRKLGKLMTRLGFRKVKLTGGVRGYLIDYRLLARLVRRYEVKSSVIPPSITT